MHGKKATKIANCKMLNNKNERPWKWEIFLTHMPSEHVYSFIMHETLKHEYKKNSNNNTQKKNQHTYNNTNGQMKQ